MTEITNHRRILRNTSTQRNISEISEAKNAGEAPLDMNLVKLLFVGMIPVVAYAFSWVLFAL